MKILPKKFLQMFFFWTLFCLLLNWLESINQFLFWKKFFCTVQSTNLKLKINNKSVRCPFLFYVTNEWTANSLKSKSNTKAKIDLFLLLNYWQVDLTSGQLMLSKYEGLNSLQAQTLCEGSNIRPIPRLFWYHLCHGWAAS